MRVRGRFDHGTLRSAGFVALLTVVFLVTNTAVAAAADGSGTGGGLLGPLDIVTREGVPLSGYQLESSVASQTVGERVEDVVVGNSMPFDVIGETQRLLLNGLFTLVRLLVGLSGWASAAVLDFPVLRLLADPAQRLADAYQRHVVGALGLEGLLLAWAFVFGLVLFVRGKAGKGLGEIVLTLVIAALAASAFVRPDYLLGKDGPLQQTHQAAIEVASITTASYFDTPARGGRPCDTAVGPAHDACVAEQADAKTVTAPIQAALTDALVVKPYMLLQYGRILDPNKEGQKAAYGAHLKWVKGNAAGQTAAQPADGDDPCALLDGPSKTYCQDAQKQREKAGNCEHLDPQSEKRCREQVLGKSGFPGLVQDLEGAGGVGKSAAAYAQQPSWDRVWGVLALLIAALVVTLMVVSMSVVMLGAQGADAAAAAGGPIAWVWAMLPGPSRMLLWRWLGVFVVSALVSFMAAMALPLFGIAVDAILADSGPDQMMERLFLVDALALAFLVLHRRILRATAGFGQRMATRMRYAKVGGSHLPGDNSELGAALAMHGPTPGSGSGGLGGGASAAHGAFGARLRSLGSFAALSDPAGMPMNPGRLLGDAVAEGRRGIAPLAIALRAAHTALIGPPPGRHPAAARLHAYAKVTAAGRAGGGADGGEMVVDEWTGEILHDPATDRPLLGSRIHARASRLRGYRVASRTARVAYGATLGLPRTLSTTRAAASEFTTDARTQLRVASRQVRQDADRWMQPVGHAGQALATAWQVHDPAGTIRDTALAAAVHAAPLTGTPVSRPDTSVSAPRTPGGRRPSPVSGPALPAEGGISPGRSHMVGARGQAPQARPQAAGQVPAEDRGGAEAEADAARLRRIFAERAAAARRRREEDGR
ncbi:hypothetical protein [Streptomyces sp. NRRL F-2664]|uniref:hypothetical protein n=1 Tax=Streptomyces sp. NRRL F-2664 TaxID=1463842 RepID=UPI0004C757D6|nr:hypothetical protein [Streptomyces sp. NRRL F-2664]